MDSDKPFDLKTTDPIGMTVLLWSARNGHTRMTQYLLEKGAIKEASCIHGMRAIHHACNNNREVVNIAHPRTEFEYIYVINLLESCDPRLNLTSFHLGGGADLNRKQGRP